jgi:predicted ATPase/class 3 adenylate cyclase/Tfp pilus assembly protein PilF
MSFLSSGPAPTGTITFLFTDIEGSTMLWEQHPPQMKHALHRHDTLLRSAIEQQGGYVFKTVGDAFCAAFPTAPQGLLAAIDSQRLLSSEAWPAEIGQVRVRMALHTGATEEREGDYVGPILNRVSRLLSAGYGGQVLLTQSTYELVRHTLPPGITLRDMGERRLKDLQQPDRIFQLSVTGLASEFPPLKTLDTLPNNLPIQLTSFIGREREMEQVKQLLSVTRLLTLIGPGGTGKTRLSLHVAADLLDLERFPHGVWLVELAPLADPTLVPQAVAAALGVREGAGRSTLESLKEYLHSKQLLLVLDNCEHLVEACAQLADALLRSCPNLKILASSREALGIGGETIWRVPSLSLPDPGHFAVSAKAGTQSNFVSTLSQYEAVRLFIDRAQAALPSFKVTNQNAPAVAQICHRLDGIPLAIELAVARVRALSVEQISARLDDRFRLLTGGSRTALPRQQTLRATIDWSYGLLSEVECVILRRLSVFAGGWTPEAAEAVCAGGDIEEYEVLDSLMRLVDKSLVTFEQAEGGEAGDPGEGRYRLLETIRQYARDKLLEAGEGEIQRVRDRHMRYFLNFIEEAEPRLLGVSEGPWLDRVEREHDNLRLAMEWSLQGSSGVDLDGGDGVGGGDTEASKVERAELGLRIAGALSEFWNVRGHSTEGSRWSKQMLAVQESLGGGRTVGRAKALVGLGRLGGLKLGELKAHTLHTEALEIYRELGHKFGMIRPLSMLGHIANGSGDYDSARSFYEQALTIARELGETKRVIAGFANLGYLTMNQGNYAEAKALFEEGIRVALTLNIEGVASGLIAGLGSVAINEGDYDKAKSFYEESLAQNRALRNRDGVEGNLWMLAHIARRQGEYERAQALFTESMIMAQDLEMTESIAMNLQGMAELALVRDEPERATKLLGAFQAVFNLMGAEVYFESRTAFDESKAALLPQLGEEGWRKAFEEGHAMSMEQAIKYALDESSRV